MLHAALTGIALGSDFDFGGRIAYPIGNGAEMPRAVAVGDLNGDGRLDAASASESGRIHIFLQGASGSMLAPYTITFASRTEDAALVLVDFDDDGDLDIISGSEFGVGIHLNDSNGNFADMIPVGSGRTAHLNVMDVDGDLHLDIVAQKWPSDSAIYYGDGLGGVSYFGILRHPPFSGAAVGDVNGDGGKELVMVDHEKFVVYSARRDGGFGQPSVYELPNDNASLPFPVAVGDFNGDEREDVAIVVQSRSLVTRLLVFAQDFGILQPSQSIGTSFMAVSLVAHDVDGDGFTDLLAGRNGGIGRHMQSAGAMGPLTESDGAYFENWSSRSLAAGDVTGDGCVDAVGVDVNSGLVVFPGLRCKPRTIRSDYDGDGRSDVLWYNGTNGQPAIWKSASFNAQQAVTRVTNLDWQIAGHGDFDGDGREDLLWRNRRTGANAIWSAARYDSQIPVTGVSNTAWYVAAVDDLDGDRMADILWMNRNTGQRVTWRSGQYSNQTQAVFGSTEWALAGTGDFDADGVGDLLWRSPETGRVAIDYGSGDYENLTTVSNLNWKIAGVGDFDGDRRSDVLWHNQATGASAIWRDGHIGRQINVAPRSPGHSWEIAATGDYDGDGQTDILWRNAVTGTNEIWPSADMRRARPAQTVTNTAWRVVP